MLVNSSFFFFIRLYFSKMLRHAGFCEYLVVNVVSACLFEKEVDITVGCLIKMVKVLPPLLLWTEFLLLQNCQVYDLSWASFYKPGNILLRPLSMKERLPFWAFSLLVHVKFLLVK
jgi:hypothetical protein